MIHPIDTARVWQDALSDMEIQMRQQDFRTWFSNTDLLSFDGQTCVIGVENPFNLDWLTNKCSALVSRTLGGLLETAVVVQFIAKPVAPTAAVPDLTLTSPPTESVPRRRTRRPSTPPRLGPIATRYTFDSFVVGPHNQLAQAASLAVAERPGEVHNPLFIYGGVGLGKTHLLHSIAHSGIERGLEVIYVSSETFTNEFIDSISRGRMGEFRTKYRHTDILLIDDIQFLAGKEQTQEEFFHTFNSIHEANGQIVITSDRHPKAITTLTKRLESRFLWGLMADIQPPELETRTAILRKKLEESQRNGQAANVPNDVLDFIAAKVPSNVRELEGALNRVLAHAAALGTPVTLDLAATALHEVLEPSGRIAYDPATVIKAVCRFSSLTQAELAGPQRDQNVVVPRQMAMFLLRETGGYSYAEIGKHFGGRDHSTVMHACAKITRDAETDEALRGKLRAVRELLARSA